MKIARAVRKQGGPTSPAPFPGAEPPAIGGCPGDRRAAGRSALGAPALVLLVAVAVYALGHTTPRPGRQAGPLLPATEAVIPGSFSGMAGRDRELAASNERYLRWLERLKDDNPRLYHLYMTDFLAEYARLNVAGQWPKIDHQKVWQQALRDYDATACTRRTHPHAPLE